MTKEEAIRLTAELEAMKKYLTEVLALQIRDMKTIINQSSEKE